MTNKFNLFVDDLTPNEIENRKIIVEERQLFIRRKNIAMFRSTNARFYDVLYESKLKANFISISKLCEFRNKSVFDQKSMTILNFINFNRIFLRAKRSKHENLYYVTKVNDDVNKIIAIADDFNMIDVETIKISNLNFNRAYHQRLKIKNSKNKYTL